MMKPNHRESGVASSSRESLSEERVRAEEVGRYVPRCSSDISSQWEKLLLWRAKVRPLSVSLILSHRFFVRFRRLPSALLLMFVCLFGAT